MPLGFNRFAFAYPSRNRGANSTRSRRTPARPPWPDSVPRPASGARAALPSLSSTRSRASAHRCAADRLCPGRLAALPDACCRLGKRHNERPTSQPPDIVFTDCECSPSSPFLTARASGPTRALSTDNPHFRARVLVSQDGRVHRGDYREHAAEHRHGSAAGMAPAQPRFFLRVDVRRVRLAPAQRRCCSAIDSKSLVSGHYRRRGTPKGVGAWLDSGLVVRPTRGLVTD